MRNQRSLRKRMRISRQEEGNDIDIPEGDEDSRQKQQRKSLLLNLLPREKLQSVVLLVNLIALVPRAIKKVPAKIPKRCSCKTRQTCCESQKTSLWESLEESISILSGLKAGDVLTNEQLKTIRSGLMDHLYESISAGESRGEVYQGEFHDVALLCRSLPRSMQEKMQKVEEKRYSYYGELCYIHGFHE